MVAILLGCNVPYLLRECKEDVKGSGEGKRYQLIGTCYVHGIMNGEVMDEEMMKRAEDVYLV